MTSPLKPPCSSCSRPWAEGAFYQDCAECKDCKRGRSRRNRAIQARKIAAFERFVDVLTALTARADLPTSTPGRARTEQPRESA